MEKNYQTFDEMVEDTTPPLTAEELEEEYTMLMRLGLALHATEPHPRHARAKVYSASAKNHLKAVLKRKKRKNGGPK